MTRAVHDVMCQSPVGFRMVEIAALCLSRMLEAWQSEDGSVPTNYYKQSPRQIVWARQRQNDTSDFRNSATA